MNKGKGKRSYTGYPIYSTIIIVVVVFSAAFAFIADCETINGCERNPNRKITNDFIN